jgi:uncharacterized protein
MIVSNSSPIITLGKLGVLDLLRKCFSEIHIPKSVFSEIMEKEESAEAKSLEKAVNDGWIFIHGVEVDKAIETRNLGQGEKEAISLAEKMKCMLLIDDDGAKRYASILDVESHGTLFVFYLSAMKRFIDKEKAKALFEGMIKDGFYISTDVYAEFLNLLDEIQ